MSVYFKISYKTKNVNSALKECIMYIGKYYGKNKEGDDLYKSGKCFLSKKVKGASKISINRMVYPKSIKCSKMKEWRFKKCSYERTYRYIIYIMLKNEKYKENAMDLLHNLYLELFLNDNNMYKALSNILVLDQKNALLFASDKPQYKSDQKFINNVLKCFDECDKIYADCIK